MAFNSQTVADELVTLLAAISGMGAAQIGAPESVGPQVISYVTLGGLQVERVTTGIVQRESRYFCMLAYRVDGAESTAETTLMDAVDDVLAALHADLTLNGTVTSLDASSATADEPEYQMRAGKEYREYPIVVRVTQRDAYTVNP